MAPRYQVSLGRKSAFYLGYLLMAGGVLLILSMYLVGLPGSPSRLGSLAIRALAGIAFIFLGWSMRRIAIRGLAGSLVILDPPRAREDLEPWSRAAGGLLDAALSEVDVLKAAAARAEGQGPARVMTVCPRCQSQNDGKARFCDQCGGGL